MISMDTVKELAQAMQIMITEQEAQKVQQSLSDILEYASGLQNAMEEPS